MELVELVKMLDMEGGSGWKNGKLNGMEVKWRRWCRYRYWRDGMGCVLRWSG